MKTIENMGLEAIDLHGPVKLSREVEGFREVVRSKVSKVCLCLVFFFFSLSLFLSLTLLLSSK